MHIPRLPEPILDLRPGELVHYRWWCAKKNDWITDCATHIVLAASAEGATLVLMAGKQHRVPTMLLKRVDDPLLHFAAVEERESNAGD